MKLKTTRSRFLTSLVTLSVLSSFDVCCLVSFPRNEFSHRVLSNLDRFWSLLITSLECLGVAKYYESQVPHFPSHSPHSDKSFDFNNGAGQGGGHIKRLKQILACLCVACWCLFGCCLVSNLQLCYCCYWPGYSSPNMPFLV